MARHCTVCAHPDREAIDLALLGGAVIAQLGKDKGLNASSLSRHRDRHIPVQVARSVEILEELRADQLVSKLSALCKTVEQQIVEARNDRDHRAVAALAGQATKMCGLLMNHYGQLPRAQTINIIASVEWQQLQTMVLRALGPYPEARHAVALALSEPSG